MDHVRLWKIHEYDRRRHTLREIVSSLLEEAPLEALGGAQYRPPRFSREQDQSTPYHRRFYQEFDRVIRPRYEALIDEIIAPIVSEPFCFQMVPTFRVHLPDNVAVGEFHRDADYAHLAGEQNFWLPLTAAWDTNSVWIEDPETTRLWAVSAFPGQIVQFDALNLMHGNLLNDTGSTRVSFDFRCIPLRVYVPKGGTSVNVGRRLEIGDYYKIYEGSGQWKM
jgi:hypothetical protein